MMNVRGFNDLNINVETKDKIPSLEKWHDYHYSTIAFNQTLDLSTISEPKKKKKGEKTEISLPDPIEVKLPHALVGKIKILNRLTVKFADSLQFPKIFQGKANTLKKYDIIAVVPTEQSALQQAISTNDVDLISIECQSKPTWQLTKKLYSTAIEQHKYFEICYGPTLKDSSTLKNTIFLAHLFYTIGKSKNLIISSGTAEPDLLRSPYEVIFLSFMYGFGQNRARTAITTIPSSLVDRGFKRRLGKGCISVTSADS